MEDSSGSSYGSSGSGNKKRSKKSKKSDKQSSSPKNATITIGDDAYPSDLPRNTKDTKYPVQFDWTKVVGVIREVINQGNRRTCWTIASTRSLSARLVADKNFATPLCLSALHVLVGLIKYVDNSGGLQNLEQLREFMVDHGTVHEEDCQCPQLALDSKKDRSKSEPVLCTEKRKAKPTPTFKVEDLIIVENVDETELIRLVKEGPVAVSIDAYKEFSNFTGDGIYFGPTKRSSLKIDKHLFLLLGYGTENGVHFWRTQNSAGTNWGNKGFGKIARKISLGGGKPSLFTCYVYPKLLDHYDGQKLRM